jgi:DNA-binding IclR family transcriptional regulator
MRVYVDTEVMKELGIPSAIVLEHIFMKAPHYNIKTKLNVSALARDLPISLSTLQRLVKTLLSGGWLIKENNEFSLAKKFFITFTDYKTYLDYE